MRKANGLPVGRPPYGGLPGEDPQVVLRAFHEAGSYNRAALLLNERGVPTRGGSGLWTGKQVYRVVRRIEPLPVTAQPRVRTFGRYALTGLLRCHCGRPMQVRQTRKDGQQAVCGFGITDPTHSRRKYRAITQLMPWVRDEAARLRVPEAVSVEVTADEAERAALEAKRERIVDAYMDGTIAKADRDRRLEAVDAALRQLAVRDEIEALPTIDWDNDPPDAINTVLRTLWEYVELDENLDPVRAQWRVPQWRAE